MSKLLIFIDENVKFDFQSIVAAITSIEGVSNARTGEFIGAVFECAFTAHGRSTVVRLSQNLETITVEGIGDESINFCYQLQKKMATPLSVIDMDYSFNLKLSDYQSVSDLKVAIQQY